MSTLGGFVRAARIRAALSGPELAEKMGYSPAWLYRIEKGRAVPSAKVLEALATALCLSPWESRYLFALAGKVRPQTDQLTDAPSQAFLDALHPNPAAWMDTSWTIVRANAEFQRLFRGAWLQPNLIFWHYVAVTAREIIVNWEVTSQWCVGWLRFGLGAGVPGVAEMVATMLPARVFREQWEAQVIPVDPSTRPWIVRDLDNGCELTLDMRAWRPAGQQPGLLLLGAVVDAV
ncbi:helix-turn-helix domain-containing protein [Mycobacterium canetti]|uniref:helix-turn-helix domain-containing protein n=1 Tax=Mycobacterium canetti TaxID=78331 RepID=UPI001E42907D|nr:helix-turn-helix domain-containing protein [Mycobacterium canetti]